MVIEHPTGLRDDAQVRRRHHRKRSPGGGSVARALPRLPRFAALHAAQCVQALPQAEPQDGAGEALLFDLRLVLFSAAAAVAVGIVLVPTGQRLFAAAITFFQANRSTAKLLLRSVTPAGLSTIRDSVVLPTVGTLQSLKGPRGVSWPVLIANAAAQGLLAVGVLASL